MRVHAPRSARAVYPSFRFGIMAHMRTPMTHGLLLMGAVIGSAAGQAPAPAQAGRAGGAPARIAPPARIVTFTAQPASIQPGQPVTLIWAAENPNATNIDQGIGKVTARGSRQVFPYRDHELYAHRHRFEQCHADQLGNSERFRSQGCANGSRPRPG